MRIRILGAFIALSLLASGCGGEAEIEGAAGTTDDVSALPVSDGTDVPAALDFLGDLAQTRGSRVTTTVDTQAQSVALEEGASIAIAAGAFAGPTGLTTQVVDLDYSKLLSDIAPWSRAYVVSTEDDVSLGAPVMIEIPRPAAELRAVQIIDGEIMPVEVQGDETSARIEIPHFSEVVTLVQNTWGEEAANAARAELARRSANDVQADDTPANFLRTCLVAVLGIWGAFTDDGVDALYSQLGYSICTNALIARSAPDGKYVSTACVGDRISGGLDFQPAVDACAAGDDDDTDSADQQDNDGDDTGTSERAEESDVPDGPVTFTGSATQGAIENPNSDDLRSADFTATIEGSTVIMQATMIVHAWHRGGYEEQFVDQNCGATYRHVLRFEGPSGNPTDLRAIVEASEILEVQGVLCDDDDAERDLLMVGDSKGRFRGQANGLGVEGTIDGVSLPLEISAG